MAEKTNATKVRPHSTGPQSVLNGIFRVRASADAPSGLAAGKAARRPHGGCDGRPARSDDLGRRPPLLDQLVTDRVLNQPHHRLRLGFEEDVFAVRFYGALRDEELVADLLIGELLGDELQDFALAH